MKEFTIYFATNRNPEGKPAESEHPSGYGTEFSPNGREDLRFGKVTFKADEEEIKRWKNADLDEMGKGDGEKLASYLSNCAEEQRIEMFAEHLDPSVIDSKQDIAKYGSQRFFSELKNSMMNKSDVLVFIHGYNVGWWEAVGTAGALEEMLNRSGVGDEDQKVMVILFSWPSDGSMMPFRAYASDRADARDSGYAVGRGILKLRDFLIRIRQDAGRDLSKLCQQDIHLLAHSMGNYVLQNAIQRIEDHAANVTLPRMFQHIFLCAPDVDDNVLEEGEPMGRLDEVSANITIYYNRDDKALLISDLTKSNPERLGTNGAAHPFKLHSKVYQIDCTDIVPGIVQHSYFMSGKVNQDIKISIDGEPQDSKQRTFRQKTGELPNLWRMKKI